MKRRNNRYREKKPTSTASMVDALLGLASALVFGGMLLVSASTEGSLPNIFGGVSVLAMLLSLGALIHGSHISKNENFSKASRVLGVIGPVVGTALWVLLYIIGIFVR